MTILVEYADGSLGRPLKYKKYRGAFVREDVAIDGTMIRECEKNYKHFDLDKHSRVLDLGANIGGFYIMCQRAGVAYYAGYEPDPENFEVLHEQQKSGIEPGEFDSWLRCEAVSTSKEKEVTFYVRPSVRNKCSSSIAPSKITKALKPVKVRNAHIDNVMNIHMPNVLKMDIEGAERFILDHWEGHVPASVDQFAIEVHNRPYINLYEKTHHKTLLEDGFKLIAAEPNSGFKNRSALWRHFGHTESSVLFGFDLLYKR